MEADSLSCPLTQRQLVSQQFMYQRTKVLDIAAFLDRLDRAAEADAENDFRLVALRETLDVLREPEPGRVERIQMILSDPTTDLLPELDRKAALGAFKPRPEV